MLSVRRVCVIGFLVVASASAQAASPAADSAAAPALVGNESALPTLELTLTEIGGTVADGRAGTAPRALRADTREGSHSPSLAQLLKTPAPYSKLLPQPIDDRGFGYRVWF